MPQEDSRKQHLAEQQRKRDLIMVLYFAFRWCTVDFITFVFSAFADNIVDEYFSERRYGDSPR